MSSFISPCVRWMYSFVITRNFSPFFPLDAMTVNHHGKYFIIRNDLRRGHKTEWMKWEKRRAREREKQGERRGGSVMKGKRTREQSKIICYRTAKIEMKPTNQPQQWQQQNAQLSGAARCFFHSVWCNQRRERSREQKNRRYNFCVCYIIMAMAGVVVGDGLSSTAVGAAAAEFGDVR